MGKPFAILPVNECTVGVLKLAFDDVEDDEDPLALPMSDEHARRIVDFFLQVKGKVELILCHCEQGISRSSGTACALSVLAGGSDAKIAENPKYGPNSRVRRMILRAAGFVECATKPIVTAHGQQRLTQPPLTRQERG